MNKIVLKTISDNGMISSGDNIIVALSGGADSVCLLHILLSLQDELSINVSAAHVNHRLRGEESQRDENFVRELCDQLGVMLFVKDCDVGALARERKVSEELCGRDVRYEFFSELSKKYSAKIATAHTLSDSEETMLYNISRGTGLHGLCSIPYKRDSVIRPLLDVTRSQIEEYLNKNGIAYVDDSTNFREDLCSRNKIRLKVLPPLRSLSEGFDKSFSRLRSQLSDVDGFMQKEALKALENCKCRYGLSSDKLKCLDPALLSYVFSKYISDCGVAPEYKHIILCKNILCDGGAVMIRHNLTAVCSQGVFRIIGNVDNESFEEINIKQNISFSYCDKEYCIEILSKSEIVNRKFAKSLIRCDKMLDGIVIRRRREGDTFSPQYRDISKPLRKLQNEQKIPKELRDRSLLIAVDSTVLWDENIGISRQGAWHDGCEYGILIDVRRRG